MLRDVRGSHRVTDQSPEEKFAALEKYGQDLTARAADGKIDPVIGRDDEIRRVIQVLSRRTKNNPVLIGEPGVGKTAIVEGLARAHRRRRRARGAQGQAADRPRHRVDARRCEVPRRVRGAPQGGPQGDHRRRRRGHHVRRRVAHHRRSGCRRRCDGRRQHDQADARQGRAADDRCHHARRVPQARREGRRARAPVPAGVRRRTVRRGHDRHPARPQGALRGPPRRAHPGLGAGVGGGPVQPLPDQPVPARQGDRPRRRGGQQAPHRDRLDADRDRRRRAPDPAARDRTGRAREGERRQRRATASTRCTTSSPRSTSRSPT